MKSDSDARLLPKKLTPERKQSLERKLRQAGLRPTPQRLLLAEHLFCHEHKHITAEKLHEAIDERVSLATVYNTLHQFTEACLLRQVVINSGKSCFDTNTSAHHHFYHEDEMRLEDIPASRINVTLDGKDPRTIKTPPGTRVSDVDVVLRLRSIKKKNRGR